MSIVVQKYGGTSVATAERVKNAARRAIAAQQQGHQVVVVVSAQGHVTDELIELANEITANPSRRELDMLLSTGEQVSMTLFAMAVHDMGHNAISFTGGQAGILTDGTFSRARIRHIKPDRIIQGLDKGNIVVVAGFQGVDDNENITTLGRGGSDTTAVALAATLKAEVCEIYTDVDGVYTADPRVVPNAQKLDTISYDEMMEMASLGAGVLYLRSVEFAKRYNVKIVVRSSLNDREGTVVTEVTPAMERVLVRGCALSKDEAQVSVLRLPNNPTVTPRFFDSLAARNINVDMIAQSPRSPEHVDLSYTVSKSDLDEAVRLTREIAQEVGAREVTSSSKIAKVSVVGVGMRSQPGVAAKTFGALGKKGIQIHMISTSEIRISCIVDEDKGDEALRAVHEAFNLGK